MNTSKKISAIITSGGKSLRFGSNKLLEKIGDMSVIQTTVSRFINLVDEIIIPCADEVKEHLMALNYDKVKFALPGSTRQKSVYSGLLACDKPDIVLIHDGARPYVDEKIIKDIIELTKQKQAAVAGVFAIDTIKEVENGIIKKTLNRSNIFQAHTPQAFSYDLIRKIHEKYKDDPNFTDDSSMAEKYGVSVYVVEDFKKNIKITTKEDLS